MLSNQETTRIKNFERNGGNIQILSQLFHNLLSDVALLADLFGWRLYVIMGFLQQPINNWFFSRQDAVRPFLKRVFPNLN